MKLREEEFYNQYHQHGGTTIIPTEIFNELYDDATEEIERLTAESTKWESKFYDECKKVDKAIEYMNYTFNISSVKEMYEIMNELEKILQGSDKE